MKALTRSVAGVTGLVLVGGCAVLPGGGDLSVGPDQPIQASASAADGQYQLGKYYLGQQRYGMALMSFSKALDYDPRHVDARNGRATVLVQMGEFKAASAELVKALEIQPDSPHLLNNLGYVKLLERDYEGAAQALRRAHALDPKNARVRANWAALAQAVPAESPLSAVDAARGLEPNIPAADKRTSLAQDAGAPRGQSPSAGEVPSNRVAAAATASSSVINLSFEARAASSIPIAHDAPTPPVSVVAPAASAPSTTVVNLPMPKIANVESRGAAPSVDAAATAKRGSADTTLAEPVLTTRARPVSARVEVANGNGVPDAAKQTGKRLRAKGVKVVRITNAKTFDVARSAIYFRDGYMNDALALSKTLGVRPAVMLSSDMHRSTDVRLILGKDVATEIAMDEGPVLVNAESPKIAALRQTH